MSNFTCPHCGMQNIDCGKDGYKTPKEIEYEKKLKKIEEVALHCMNEDCCTVCDYLECCELPDSAVPTCDNNRYILRIIKEDK